MKHRVEEDGRVLSAETDQMRAKMSFQVPFAASCSSVSAMRWCWPPFVDWRMGASFFFSVAQFLLV